LNLIPFLEALANSMSTPCTNARARLSWGTLPKSARETAMTLSLAAEAFGPLGGAGFKTALTSSTLNGASGQKQSCVPFQAQCSTPDTGTLAFNAAFVKRSLHLSHPALSMTVAVMLQRMVARPYV
jgi:hypothetical protein